MVYNRICRQCGCSLVVKHQLPKLNLRVRFPLSAPRRSKLYIACSDFLYKKSEFAHAAAPRRGEPFDSPHFLSKIRLRFIGLPLLFPQKLCFWGIPVPLCGFCSFFCKKARSARLFACKRTHWRLTVATAFLRVCPGVNFSIARRISFLYAKNPRLT